jgi:hypothetical protein
MEQNIKGKIAFCCVGDAPTKRSIERSFYYNIPAGLKAVKFCFCHFIKHEVALGDLDFLFDVAKLS